MAYSLWFSFAKGSLMCTMYTRVLWDYQICSRWLDIWSTTPGPQVSFSWVIHFTLYSTFNFIYISFLLSLQSISLKKIRCPSHEVSMCYLHQIRMSYLWVTPSPKCRNTWCKNVLVMLLLNQRNTTTKTQCFTQI